MVRVDRYELSKRQGYNSLISLLNRCVILVVLISHRLFKVNEDLFDMKGIYTENDPPLR